MTVTPAALTRASGAAAVAAGVIFLGVQIRHPHVDLTSITTAELAVRGSFKVLMATLALVGITGMYLSQVRRNGLLGLIGYLVLAVGYLLIVSTSVIAAYVLPSIAATDPSYVQAIIAVATGGPISSEIGALAVVCKVQGLCYLAGGLLFGVALYRAGVLSRWATALLAAGGLVSVALSYLPDAYYRLLAVPNGIAMIGLGLSLWKVQRQAAVQARPVTEARPAEASV